MILGYRLRELRKDNNMSQQELGKLIGVTKVSVSGYEKGTRVPSMDVLNKILDIFHISADYLLGRELNVVCEDEENISVSLSVNDIEIIQAIRKHPDIYNSLLEDSKRFFNSFSKKQI